MILALMSYLKIHAYLFHFSGCNLPVVVYRPFIHSSSIYRILFCPTPFCLLSFVYMVAMLVPDPVVDVSVSDPDEVSVKLSGFEVEPYVAAVLELAPAPAVLLPALVLAVADVELAKETDGRTEA